MKIVHALPDELRPATDYLVNDPDIIDAAFHCAGFKNPNGFTQSRLKTEYDDILSRISLPLTGDGLGHKVWPLLLKGFNGNKATLTFKMIMMLAMYIIETNPYIKQCGGKPAKVSPANTPFLAKNEGFCIRQTKRTCCRHPCAKRISIRGEAGFLRRAHKLHTPCMDLNVPTRMDGAFCFDCKRRKHTQTGGTERFSVKFAAAPPCL